MGRRAAQISYPTNLHHMLFLFLHDFSLSFFFSVSFYIVIWLQRYCRDLYIMSKQRQHLACAWWFWCEYQQKTTTATRTSSHSAFRTFIGADKLPINIFLLTQFSVDVKSSNGWWFIVCSIYLHTHSIDTQAIYIFSHRRSFLLLSHLSFYYYALWLLARICIYYGGVMRCSVHLFSLLRIFC